MKYSVRTTKTFRRDIKKVTPGSKRLLKLQEVVRLIAAGEPLPKSNRNHQLKGEYKDCLECHVEPNWLLIYRAEENEVVLIRTGTHSELFK